MLKEYFMGIIALGTFLALALGISHKKLKSATSFGAGVILISAIFLPLVDIMQGCGGNFDFEGILDKFEYEEIGDSSIEQAFESGIAEYVAVSYGVDSECVLVRVDGFDFGTLKADRIYVTLSKGAVHLDYKRIEEELEREFTAGGECEVLLKIG